MPLPDYSRDPGFEIYDIHQEGIALFQKARYSDLDAVFSNYRTQQCLTAGGSWKLYYLTDVLSSPCVKEPIVGLGSLIKKLTQATQPDLPWQDHLSRLEAWIKREPYSIAAPIVYSSAMLSYAWVARGTGYANTVTERGWRLFQGRVEIAAEVLRNNQDKCQVAPDWHCLMQIVALAQCWELDEFDDLYVPAVVQFPTYRQLYLNKLNFIKPKWGGSIELMCEFMDEAVTHTYPHMGYALYPMMVSYCVKDFNDHIEALGVDWDKMRQGFRDWLERHPNNWTLNLFAVYAYLFDDKITARELLPGVQKYPNSDVWDYMNLMVSPFILWTNRK